MSRRRRRKHRISLDCCGVSTVEEHNQLCECQSSARRDCLQARKRARERQLIEGLYNEQDGSNSNNKDVESAIVNAWKVDRRTVAVSRRHHGVVVVVVVTESMDCEINCYTDDNDVAPFLRSVVRC